MVPSSPRLLLKAIIEILGFCMLGLACMVIHEAQPFQRGFYCNDENLQHPYIEEQTVPANLAAAIWASLGLLILCPGELLRHSLVARPKQVVLVCSLPLSWLVVDLYRVLSHFLLGGLATLLLTETSKVFIGRLRPHFLDLCRPNMTACRDEEEWLFVATNQSSLEEVCQGDMAREEVLEARLSFLSGHSSTAFYSATFLALYMQVRLDTLPPERLSWVKDCVKALRPFLQVGLVCLALYISLTRVSDYFHHPYDVATGALLGMAIGLLTHTYSGLERRPGAFSSQAQDKRSPTGPSLALNDKATLDKTSIDHFTRARMVSEPGRC